MRRSQTVKVVALAPFVDASISQLTILRGSVLVLTPERARLLADRGLCELVGGDDVVEIAVDAPSEEAVDAGAPSPRKQRTRRK